MSNYEKAKQLLASGMAEKHFTYCQTGIISVNLGDKFWAYIGKDDEHSTVVKDNSVEYYANISDDLKSIDGTRYNRHEEIVPW